MGYLMTYAFMLFLAFAMVGGYTLHQKIKAFQQKCKAIYKEELGE